MNRPYKVVKRTYRGDALAREDYVTNVDSELAASGYCDHCNEYNARSWMEGDVPCREAYEYTPHESTVEELKRQRAEMDRAREERDRQYAAVNSDSEEADEEDEAICPFCDDVIVRADLPSLVNVGDSTVYRCGNCRESYRITLAPEGLRVAV